MKILLNFSQTARERFENFTIKFAKKNGPIHFFEKKEFIEQKSISDWTKISISHLNNHSVIVPEERIPRVLPHNYFKTSLKDKDFGLDILPNGSWKIVPKTLGRIKQKSDEVFFKLQESFLIGFLYSKNISWFILRPQNETRFNCRKVQRGFKKHFNTSFFFYDATLFNFNNCNLTSTINISLVTIPEKFPEINQFLKNIPASFFDLPGPLYALMNAINSLQIVYPSLYIKNCDLEDMENIKFETCSQGPIEIIAKHTLENNNGQLK